MKNFFLNKRLMIWFFFLVAVLCYNIAGANPPPVDVEITAPLSVVRISYASLTTTTVGGSGQYTYEWESSPLLGNGNYTVTGPTTANWGGNMAVTSVITVQATDQGNPYNWDTDAVTVEVTIRNASGWLNVPTATWTDNWNGAQDQFDTPHQPPMNSEQVGKHEPRYILYNPNTTQVNGGPNNGVKYVISTGSTYYTSKGFLNSDLTNDKATFYLEQGDYPGEINGDVLRTHTRRHEYNSTDPALSHHGVFIQKKADPNNDMGVTAERQLAVLIDGVLYFNDGSTGSDFNAYIKNKMNNTWYNNFEPAYKSAPHPLAINCDPITGQSFGNVDYYPYE